MRSLAGVEAFVHTAELSSFRGAAERLGRSPAAISKAVARLEEELGVRLLHRTSRVVSLTPEGAIYLSHCRDALDRLAAGRERMREASAVPRGTLRVSLSYVLGRPLLAELARFAERFGELSLELSFSDRWAGLIEEEVDVALRIGDLPDSSLLARRLATPRWCLVASPTYLARHGRPGSAAALAAHRCVRFRGPAGTLAPWASPAGSLDPGAAVVVDDGTQLLEAVRADLGVGQLFAFMAREPMRRGELVPVLPELDADAPPIQAVWLPGTSERPRVRAFLDFAQEALTGLTG